jgi:beta-1,4-N-acetylglucosaminyltransferase
VIFVTVGGMRPFDRLVTAMDRLAGDLEEEVVMQTGTTAYEPRNCRHFSFMPREEIDKLYAGARLVICHAGIGSILTALEHGKPLILVPRMRRYKEHIDDHQLEIAREMEARGVGVVYDVSDLAAAVENAGAQPMRLEGGGELVARLREYLDGLEGGGGH